MKGNVEGKRVPRQHWRVAEAGILLGKEGAALGMVPQVLTGLELVLTERNRGRD